MSTKEKIYQLDDIGFVGTQESLSQAERQIADNAVHAYIWAHKQ